MTSAEIMAAFIAESPIIHTHARGETEYLKINAIRYYLQDGKMEMAVELLDLCKRSVTTVGANTIKLKELVKQ